MNPKSLIKNRKMLAIITVVLCATLGLSVTSYASADSNQTQNSGTNPNQQPPTIQGSVDLKQMLLSSVKTKFIDAANTAAGAVTNGQVLGGSLTVVQGYVVYTFKVFDGTNIYSVVVDAGSGKILNTSQGHPMQLGSLFGMGHSGMMHKFHMSGFTQQSQQPSSVPANPPLGTQ